MSGEATISATSKSKTMVQRHPLYSQECIEWLRTALEKAGTDLAEPSLNYYDTRQKEDSSSEEENEQDTESSSGSESDESDHEQRKPDEGASVSTSMPPNVVHEEPSTQSVPGTSAETEPTKRQAKKNSKERQLETLIHQMGVPPLLELPLDDAVALKVPSALLDKHERHYSTASCQRLLQLAQDVALPSRRPVVVLLLRSGRFAGGVFVKDSCLQHRTCQRYTVRRGQGKAQSSQDGSRRPKSMGAQLRRQGEVALWQDVEGTMRQWKHYLKETPLVLVSCPKTMQKGLLDITRDLFDKRIIRKIPLDVGRPTFESVCAVYQIMMQCQVGEGTPAEDETAGKLADESSITKASDDTPKRTEDESTREAKATEKEFPPLSPLHAFALEGNLTGLEELLDSDSDACAELIDHVAGPDFMTALHFAAESATNNVDPETAAAIVSLLLVQGKASPCVVDSRNRVPYFLASCDKVREAFRRARAELGEECWPWDDARVGPALTDQDVARKQEKAAEKKRRQRARQKEKKAREKAQAQEMEQRMKQVEEKRKQEEEAKRIRDGLAPKASGATNVCDFCQTICKGKRRSQMFHRLDYKYCSSECVQKHKRELMAQAALSRLS